MAEQANQLNKSNKVEHNQTAYLDLILFNNQAFDWNGTLCLKHLHETLLGYS